MVETTEKRKRATKTNKQFQTVSVNYKTLMFYFSSLLLVYSQYYVTKAFQVLWYKKVLVLNNRSSFMRHDSSSHVRFLVLTPRPTVWSWRRGYCTMGKGEVESNHNRDSQGRVLQSKVSRGLICARASPSINRSKSEI